jgi:hypothetical protein
MTLAAAAVMITWYFRPLLKGNPLYLVGSLGLVVFLHGVQRCPFAAVGLVDVHHKDTG